MGTGNIYLPTTAHHCVKLPVPQHTQAGDDIVGKIYGGTCYVVGRGTACPNNRADAPSSFSDISDTLGMCRTFFKQKARRRGVPFRGWRYLSSRWCHDPGHRDFCTKLGIQRSAATSRRWRRAHRALTQGGSSKTTVSFTATCAVVG